MIGLEMENYNLILTEKPLSALWSGKIGKYEYLSGKGIIPSNQQQIIERAKFTYPPLGKAFEKQIKTIEHQGEKQINTLKDLKPKAITYKSDDDDDDDDDDNLY